MRKLAVYYIDKNGNKIYNPKVDFHDTLAMQILKQNSEIKEEFEQSQIDSPSLFLITKGYLLVTEDTERNYQDVMFCCLSLNERTTGILGALKENGSHIYDIIRNDLSQVQLQEIKQLLKDGYKKEEIIRKVVQDMIGSKADLDKSKENNSR